MTFLWSFPSVNSLFVSALSTGCRSLLSSGFCLLKFVIQVPRLGAELLLLLSLATTFSRLFCQGTKTFSTKLPLVVENMNIFTFSVANLGSNYTFLFSCPNLEFILFLSPLAQFMDLILVKVAAGDLCFTRFILSFCWMFSLFIVPFFALPDWGLQRLANNWRPQFIKQTGSYPNRPYQRLLHTRKLSTALLYRHLF